MSTLAERIAKHEGTRLRPYLDCCGKPWRECVCEKKGYLTIGNGRNLDVVGISFDECRLFETNDIFRAKSAAGTFRWFAPLDPVRREVIIEMIFELGLVGFCAFKRLILAMERGDYVAAASEMLASKWSSQVGRRAVGLAEMMRTGECNEQ
jgi:lysozyme